MDYDDFCQLRSQSSHTRRCSGSSTVSQDSTSSSQYSISRRSSSSSTVSQDSSSITSPQGAFKRSSFTSSLSNSNNSKPSNRFRRSYLKNHKNEKDKTNKRRSFISDRLSAVLGETSDDAMALLVCREFEELEI